MIQMPDRETLLLRYGELWRGVAFDQVGHPIAEKILRAATDTIARAKLQRWFDSEHPTADSLTMARLTVRGPVEMVGHGSPRQEPQERRLPEPWPIAATPPPRAPRATPWPDRYR